MLNGQPLNLRGVGLHEDSQHEGLRDRQRRARPAAAAEAKALGATLIRSHYPLHPYMLRAGRPARDAGLVRGAGLPGQDASTSSARSCASSPPKELAENVAANQQPPVGHRVVDRQRARARARARCRAPTSSARPRPAKRSTRRARSASPSPATPTAGCQTEYAPLDVIGINEYFGWYPGPQRPDRRPRRCCADYLDASAQLLPDKAIVITEFGAEANRDGPVEEQRHLPVPAGLRRTTTSASTRRSRGCPARSTGRCRSSACARTGRAATRARAADPPEGPDHARRPSRSPRSVDVQRIFSGDAADRRPPSARAVAVLRPALSLPSHRRSWPTRRPPSSTSSPASRRGSRATRRLRRDGLVPGVLYGGGEEPVTLRGRRARPAPRAAARGAVLELSRRRRRGARRPSLKDIQRHPVRGDTMHVDLLRVDLNVADPGDRRRSSSSASRMPPASRGRRHRSSR